MKFEEALLEIKNNPKKKMYHSEMSYRLMFDNNDFLIIEDFFGHTLSPYVMHRCDFDYDWEVK